MRCKLLFLALSLAVVTSVKAAPIVGGEARVIAHSLVQFIDAGLKVGFIVPAGPASPLSAIFPVVGGDTDTGLIELDGGISFTANGNLLEVDNIIVDFKLANSTADVTINNQMIARVTRTVSFNCAAIAASANPCFDEDGTTVIDDPLVSGSAFTEEAKGVFATAFPGIDIDFDSMLLDVTSASIQVIPIPNIAIVFALAATSALGWRRANIPGSVT